MAKKKNPKNSAAKTKPQSPQQATKSPPDSPLKVVAKHRGRPVIFVSAMVEDLGYSHLFQLERELDGMDFAEIDLVLHSLGGSPHAAYQMARLLRFHAKKMFACVPVVATSAATLLCLASDTLFLGETAQLGPLDAQVQEERKAGKHKYTSALNPFKMLEQLQKYSSETFDFAFKMIERRTDLDHNDCCTHAIEFVKATLGQMYTHLDPEKFGEYSRALLVGSEYGDRLLKEVKQWEDAKRKKVLDKLVHGYPSHDFMITYHEIKEMGFEVELVDSQTRNLMEKAVFDLSPQGESVVKCETPN